MATTGLLHGRLSWATTNTGVCIKARNSSISLAYERQPRPIGEKLQADTASHLRHYRDVRWDNVPGFISLLNFIYCVTEIIEFTTRMAQSGVYERQVGLSVEIKGIRGFVLTTSWERAWSNYYTASEDVVGTTWNVEIEQLLSDSGQCALNLVVWFFERFGWVNPPQEVLRKDIADFQSGRR